MRLDLLAALAGIFVAVQSRANGELAFRLQNSLEAACISFGSGLVILSVLTYFHVGIKNGLRSVFRAVHSGVIPRWRLFGGALGGVVIAIQTHIVPLIGVAIYSVSVIAGQTAISLLVDRLGLTGGGKRHISARRITAAVLTVLAVVISVWDRLDAQNLSIIAIVLGAVSGGIIGVQRALNGQVNEHSGQSFATTFLNFVTGTALLLLLFVGGILTHQSHLSAIKWSPWWMYLGGVTGIIYIAFASTVVQHLGVLTFTLFSVGGQLVGALLFDIFLPSKGVHVGAYLITGIFMTYIGVLANSERSGSGRRSG
ncbi:MAG TPA: DMT family transporter [Candidatus Nanopelagicaceae bacterium]